MLLGNSHPSAGAPGVCPAAPYEINSASAAPIGTVRSLSPLPWTTSWAPPPPSKRSQWSSGRRFQKPKRQAPSRRAHTTRRSRACPRDEQPQNATGPATRLSRGRWLLDGAAPRLWCGQAISGTRRWAIANSKSRSSSTSARTSSVPVALSLSNCSLFRSIASTLS